jgi:energy-coupling factor transporter transmembrane protein EcfT
VGSEWAARVNGVGLAVALVGLTMRSLAMLLVPLLLRPLRRAEKLEIVE